MFLVEREISGNSRVPPINREIYFTTSGIASMAPLCCRSEPHWDPALEYVWWLGTPAGISLGISPKL